MTYILSYILFLYYYLQRKRNNSSHIYEGFLRFRVASQAFPFVLRQLPGLYLWWRDHGCSWIWLEESLRRAEKGLSGSCSRGPARAERQDRDTGAGGPGKMSVGLLKVSDALRICWICLHIYYIEMNAFFVLFPSWIWNGIVKCSKQIAIIVESYLIIKV